MDPRLAAWLLKLSRHQFVTRPQVPPYAREAIEALLFQGAVQQQRVKGVLRYEVIRPELVAAAASEAR